MTALPQRPTAGIPPDQPVEKENAVPGHFEIQHAPYLRTTGHAPKGGFGGKFQGFLPRRFDADRLNIRRYMDERVGKGGDFMDK